MTARLYSNENFPLPVVSPPQRAPGLHQLNQSQVFQTKSITPVQLSHFKAESNPWLRHRLSVTADQCCSDSFLPD
jgi:hypothetical protein